MRSISELGEFPLIARIAKLARALPAPDVIVGIGDDAAVLRPRAGEDLVVSSDTLVEDVHFRWADESPRGVGRRALIANLSDLAAMGARPLGFTLAFAAPPALPLPTFDGLLRGLLVEAREHGCPLIGGNLARARETHLAITVLGAVRRGRALRRSGLAPGDRIFVTGSLGASALAVARAERQGRPIRRMPVPRLEAGQKLAAMRGVGGCIDVSDGLLADLLHMLEASDVGAVIEASDVPMPRGFARGCAELGLDPRDLALGGGEDYELLFSLRQPGTRSATQPGAAVLGQRLGVTVAEIGSVTRTRELRVLGDGTSRRVRPGEGTFGWHHF